MVVRNQNEVLSEVVVGLRNADIFTTTQRSVTTTTTTGSLAGSATITINASNVKNIRNLTIGSTAQSFGTNYTVDYDINNTCVITLTNAVTEEYSISYDYGADKIFIGYPRNDLTLSSFPRIAVEYIDMVSEAGGFGNVNRNRHDLTISVYDDNKEDVRAYIYSIRNWLVTNQNSLYYLKLIKPSSQGPIVIAGEFEKFKDRIFKQNQDFSGLLDYEVN